MNRRRFLKCAATGLFLPSVSLIAGTAVPFHAVTKDTADWVRRVGVNGGATPSNNTISAIDQFVRAIYRAGLRQRMISVNCFAPDNLIAAITPLWKDLGNDPWTNSNFVVGDLTINGLAGNASNKHLDTGVVPSTAWPLNNTVNKDASLTLYNSTGSNETAIDMGGLAGGQNVILRLSAGGNSEAQLYTSNTSVGDITVANSLWTGFLSASRTSSSTMEMYKANSTTAFVRIGNIVQVYQNGTGLANSIFVFDGNGLSQPISKRIAFAQIGYGMDATQTKNLFIAVQNLRMQIGGGFV